MYIYFLFYLRVFNVVLGTNAGGIPMQDKSIHANNQLHIEPSMTSLDTSLGLLRSVSRMSASELHRLEPHVIL